MRHRHTTRFWSGVSRNSSTQFMRADKARAVLYTWALNNAEGSLIIAVLFHLSGNVANDVAVGFLRTPVQVYIAFLAGLYVAYAVIVAIVAGPAHLSHTHERNAVRLPSEPAS